MTSDSRRVEEIFVRVGEGELPFSKWLLEQSLLPTGIDATDAHDVARSIERELVATGRSSIDHGDLRALAAAAVERRVGGGAAERYLLWRRFQGSTRPLLVLLGGTSGVGKSSIAIEVARRLGIARVLSTDSIRQVMRLMSSPDLVPALFGSSYDAHQLLPSVEDRHPTVVEGFRAQAQAVSLGVRASLDRAVEENTSLVIDGVSIVPGLLDLKSFSGAAHVVSLLITASDAAELLGRFERRSAGQPRRFAHRYVANFAGILEIQQYLAREAARHGVPIIDNVGFEPAVRQVIGHVMEALAAETAHRG